MTVREPLRLRKAFLAGAVALALTGTGAAIAWSATGTPTPTPDTPSAAAPDTGSGKDTDPAKDKAAHARPLHSESVVKEADGTYRTVLSQRGTVDAVSSTAITVKSEDGYSQTYAVTAGTRITVIPAPAADGSPATGDDGKRLKPTDGTSADLATGDAVLVAGVKDGGTATAQRIVKGAGDGPGMGLGQGRGKGHGQGHGKGPGQSQGQGQGHGPKA